MTPTLSSLPLWWECQVSEKDTGPIGRAGKFGNALHLLAERWCEAEPGSSGDAADECGTQEYARLSRAWSYLQAWLQGHDYAQVFRAEVSFCFDPRSGDAREVGARLRRNYRGVGVLDHEIVGTADLVMAERYIDANREDEPHEPVWIRDIKTGRTPWKYQRQLEGLGAIAAKVYGATSVDVGILHCTDTGVEERAWEMDQMDIDAVIGGLGARIKHLPFAVEHPGEHCDAHWCARRNTCGTYSLWKGAT